MVDNPNTGFGRCQATHEVIIKAPMSIMMLGGGPALFTNILNAVHITNRVGSRDDFVGVNFPDYDACKKGFDRFGRSFMLVGSEESISAVLRKPDVAPLVEEFGLDDIFPHEVITGKGQAIIRERNSDRHSKGDLERRMRRADRLGKSTEGYKKGLELLAAGKKPGDYNFGSSDLFLHMDKMRFSMRVIEAQATDVVEVSTYGVSRLDNPLVCRNNKSSREAA